MPQRAQESVEVQAPLQDVLTCWSNLEPFPSIMGNVEEVRVIEGDTSHWRVNWPLGKSAELDAETTGMSPERGIVRNSIGGDVRPRGRRGSRRSARVARA
jgi:uncharacterized membrane protein